MKAQSFRIGLGVMVLAILLAGAGVGAYAWYLGLSWDFRTTTIEDPELVSLLQTPEEDSKTGLGSAVNILLLDSDTDPKSATRDAADAGTGMIMVAHIPADRSGIQLVSIPPDAEVELPGHGRAPINEATAIGGLPLAVETVSQLLGAEIAHLVVIDFAGFWELTDIVGGIDVDSSAAFETECCEFTEGTNHLDGKAALAFVREREALTGGELQRIRNQQEYMRAISIRLLSANYLREPVRFSTLITDLSPYMTVDPGLNASALAGLGSEISGLDEDDVDAVTVPTTGSGKPTDDQALQIDWDGLNDLKLAIAADAVSEYSGRAEARQ